MTTQTAVEGDLAIGSQLQLHRSSDFLTSQSGPTLARVGDRLFLLGGALNPGSVQSLVTVAAKSAEQKAGTATEASSDKPQYGKDKDKSSNGDDKPAAAPASPARPAPAPVPAATPFIWEVRKVAPCPALAHSL